MHPKSTVKQSPSSLQLERLPSGELAWLRPELQDRRRRYVLPARYMLTQRGRDYLAHQRALQALSAPWPTLAAVERLAI